MAAVKDEAGLRAYLEDHVRYERVMLAHAFRAMHATPEGAGWNMAFESFCVHARNLYDFLRHDGKKANTFRADDYVAGRSKPDAFLEFNELDTFLFHMSAGRADRAKMNLERSQALGQWLDREWKVWIDGLDHSYAALLLKRPVCAPPALSDGVTLATACSHPTSISSTFGQ